MENTEMKKIDVSELLELANERAPIYCAEYGDEIAQIVMDENGRVYARTRPKNGIPVSEYHGVILTWSVCPNLSGRQLAELAQDDEFLEFLQTIHNGHEEDWDENGNNCGMLTREADEAKIQLGRWLESWEGEIVTYDAEDLLFIASRRHLLDVWPAGETLDTVVAREMSEMPENYHVDDDMEEAILEKAMEMVRDEEPGLSADHLEILRGWFADADDLEKINDYLARI